MKYSLTVSSDNPSDLAALLAHLGGSTAMNVTTVTSTASDDDESNDAPAVAGQLDANGLPHDSRIHSEPAKLTGKGVWRKGRGVSDQLIATVEAELRARMANTVPVHPQPMFDAGTPAMQPVQQPMQQPTPQMQPQQPIQQYQPVMQPGPQTQPPMQQPAPQMQPVQQPIQQPVQQPAPQPTGVMDFNQFMGALTQQMGKRDANGAPLIDAAYLANVTQEIATAFNTPLSVITDLSNHPHMLGYAVQIFQRDQRWS